MLTSIKTHIEDRRCSLFDMEGNVHSFWGLEMNTYVGHRLFFSQTSTDLARNLMYVELLFRINYLKMRVRQIM